VDRTRKILLLTRKILLLTRKILLLTRKILLLTLYVNGFKGFLAPKKVLKRI